MRGFIVVGTFALLSATAACGDDPEPGSPLVDGATLTTDEDTPVSHVVQARDPAGRALGLRAGPAMHGAIAVDRMRVFYTPDPDFNGADMFTVFVTNGVTEVSAQVTVMVRPVNDAPVAAGDSFAATEDTPLVTAQATLLANDTDVDADTLTVTEVSGAMNGTVALDGGEVTFTPAQDFVGEASYQYTMSDGAATSTATVTITVGGTNDAPVAAPDDVDAQEDTPLQIAATTLVANDTDAEGQSLAVSEVDNATNGTVALDAGTITFTPAADFHGTATFEYTVTDGAASDTATVTVTVAAVNDPPVAADDAAMTAHDTPLVLAASALLANDTDVDGPALEIAAVMGAVNGTVVLDGGAVTFTPDPGYTGAASFDYVVSDGTASDIGTVAITVAPPAVCGDGATTFPETCDDGGTAPDDGCDGACATEPGWECAGAPSVCTTVCGDGEVVGAEECDDGNAEGGDGCSATCQLEDGCGDGEIDTGEECDDGNTQSGDGCSATCAREVLSVFSFTGAAGNEPTLPADGAAPGLAAVPVMSRGAGLGVALAGGEFSAQGWTTAAAPDLADYYAFTVAPATGVAMTLLGIELDERRSGTGPRSWSVRSSLDGFAADLATFAVPDDTAARTNQLTALGAAFANLTAPVEIRIYAWAAEGATGTWRIDNVEILGVTTGP